MTVVVESPFERLAALDQPDRDTLLGQMAKEKGVSVATLKATLIRSWRFLARPKQLPPDGDWVFWFVMAGRGFGKTKTGAEWTKDRSLEEPNRKIGLIAPTLGDLRRTMIEGRSGMLSVIPNLALLGQSREIAYNKSEHKITLANGTEIEGFSSESPDRLRGPEHHFVWGDEVSSWEDAGKGDVFDTTFNNMTLGLRLGFHPRALLTSTPKANKLTREIIAKPTTAMVRGSTFENESNLPRIFLDAVVNPLLGTRTGRQEIHAEVLDDVEGALWTLALIDWSRRPAYTPDYWMERMRRIVVAVDPNTTSGETADDAGIIVCGRGHSDQHGYVLDDRTQVSGGPRRWAAEAVNAYHDWKADKVIAEANNGGEMVALTIKGVDPSVPVKIVNASRGKRARAEPIANLYGSLEEPEANPSKVHHCGALPLLEEEMTTWDGLGESPNRMDALVWGLTDLEIWQSFAQRGSFLPEGQIPGTDIFTDDPLGGMYG